MLARRKLGQAKSQRTWQLGLMGDSEAMLRVQHQSWYMPGSLRTG